jgi:hypothetical protein
MMDALENLGSKELDKQVLTCWIYFLASKREKVDHLHASIRVHSSNQSMLNNVNQ